MDVGGTNLVITVLVLLRFLGNLVLRRPTWGDVS
jgi:hypothetical protein